MSHLPERKEKDCLNCGAIVQGRYCHMCGQENVVPKESFWHMVAHFFNDITHFDGSFFTTVKDLLFKPGFLSKEYMLGRRKKYLHPIRMYVFTSAVFFLLFFSLFSIHESVKVDTDKLVSGKDRLAYIAKMEAKYQGDTSKQYIIDRMQSLKDTSVSLTKGELYSAADDLDFTFVNFSGKAKVFSSVEEYDSVQKMLPPAERDNWLMRRVARQEIAFHAKYSNDPAAGLRKVGDVVLHRLPYMLFVSLPLFALLLKLIYIRRKQFYYADHAVFAIHFYIFSFILLILLFGLSRLQDATQAGLINYIIFFLFLLLLFYLYKAMRNFYGQGAVKTFLKFLLVALVSFIMMIVLFILFTLFSTYTL